MSGLPDDERRRRRREAMVILAAGLAVLVFTVWEARRPGDETALGNVFSFLLINLNIVLLLVLVFLVLRNVVKLIIERRRRVMGSHLRSRLVAAFVVISLFPAGVMALVSVQFISNSIDGWFSAEVESSLRGAHRLAATYYGSSADQAVVHARAIAGRLDGTEDQSSPGTKEILRDYQQTYGIGTVQVVDDQGRQVLALFNEKLPTGVPVSTDLEFIDETLETGTATRVESLGTADVIRGAAPILSAGGGRAVVIVDYVVDPSARLWSRSILDSFRQYRQLELNKRPFKNLYVLTMGLATLVVVFSAAWLGLYLARGITGPLGRLADATNAVAGGKWDVELQEEGGDEVGAVVRAFKSMTMQLKASHDALDERRRYIEAVLANIDAGVVSVDEEGVITTVNLAAMTLLSLDPAGVVGQKAGPVFDTCGYGEVVDMLTGLGSGGTGASLNVENEAAGRTLAVTASDLVRRSGKRSGWILFFEDVSRLAEAQRTEAWKEVARRIAHEIKNPLTPIQLSAQRMGRRLAGRLPAEDAELVEDCIGTIIGEVDELKGLVNEFSQFTRSGGGDKRAQCLNRVVEETLPLYRQAHPDIAMDFKAAAGLPEVLMNREAVRRALVNLLDNAVAALGPEPGVERPSVRRITVATRSEQELSRVILEVADTGPGVPAEQRARIFEPYYSTKEDGTGLGLAVVASVAQDHQAYVRLHDNEPTGTRFVIEFPVASDEGDEAQAAPA
ncbi:MAG: ATP-binding protein [Deltaproteobacteria bacterium]